LDAVHRALQAFREKRSWTALQRRPMSKDFSWDRSTRMYDELYRELLIGRTETN